MSESGASPASQDSSSAGEVNLIIGITAGAIAILVIIIFIVTVGIRRRGKRDDQTIAQSSEVFFRKQSDGTPLDNPEYHDLAARTAAVNVIVPSSMDAEYISMNGNPRYEEDSSITALTGTPLDNPDYYDLPARIAAVHAIVPSNMDAEYMSMDGNPRYDDDSSITALTLN